MAPLRTKIVCTIGPVSRSVEILEAMLLAGMNVARLNFSHGDREYHGENIVNIRKAASNVNKAVAILVDLQGPKLRVGKLQDPGVPLTQGEEIVLTTRSVIGHAGEIPVQYSSLPKLVARDDRILLDDGLLELVVLETSETEIRCRVITGGMLQSNKGMNLPRAHTSIPAITEKDKQDLTFALEQGADWIAISFVRNPHEVVMLQELVRRQSAFDKPTPVIAKIEKPEAIQNIEAIVAAADGIMVARGDLGIEASPEQVPLMQKQIISLCNASGVPVITATQMLDSMMRNPRPTRAEASDVANAILDGTDAIMLSGETTVGQYPLESVQTMARIAQRAEEELLRRLAATRPARPQIRLVAEAVSHAACETAQELGAAAIVTPTVSGHTARMVSRFRPTVPIVAFTPSPMVQRQLCLYWGVHSLLGERTTNTDQMLADAVYAAREHGYVEPGDLVVVTGGAAGSAPGTTNLIRVQVVEKIVATGNGIGNGVVQGRVRLISDCLPDAATIGPRDILAFNRTNRDCVALARQAAGLVVAEEGLDSHAARLAIELGVTAIIGVGDDLALLKDGQMVTLDPIRGQVLEAGEVR